MLEPVEVGGVTVSRATLHNEEDINRKDIREGDDVIVQRAGDVIPQIVGPAGSHRRGTKPFRMPTHCPLCGAEIVKPEGEAMHRCPNRACPSRGLETLNNWVMAAADIEGVGEQLVRRLWDLGLVRSLPDLYRLTKEQLLELDGFQEKSATNVITSIEASKTIPFRRVLFGLNIPDVGLGDRAEPRPALRLHRPPRRREPGGDHGVRGDRPRPRGVDRRVVRRRREPAARRRAAGARPALRVRARRTGRPEGRSPGRRTSSPARSKAGRASRRRPSSRPAAPRSPNSVSKKTTGLVVGEEPGASKLSKAQRTGVPLVTEAELDELLGG